MLFRSKMNRSLCLTIVYLIFIAIIVVVVWFVIPKIYDSSTDLIKNIPSYFSNISDEIRSNQWTRKLFGEEVLLSIQSHMLALLPQMGEVSSNFLTSFMDNIILFGNKAFNIFIAIVLCYYILLEKEKFCSYANKSVIVCFGRRVGSKVLDIIGMLHKNIGKYLVGKTIDSIFVAVLAVIGLYFLDSKYVILLGIIFGVTNMIPYFGPIIASLLAFAINVFYDFKIAIFVLIYLVIIQQIESLVLDPKVVGKQMGLNPFFTLMSVDRKSVV